MTTIRLFTPAAFIGSLLLLAVFGCGLFFAGYQDIIYAPATLCLLAFALLAVLPECWRTLLVPASPFALAVFAFWVYITLSLTWTTIPYASLVTYLIALTLPLTFFSLLLAKDRTAWMALGGATLLMGMLVLAGWAVIQATFLSEQYYRAHHPLPNPNNLGALLNLGFFTILPAALTRGKAGSLPYMALAAAGVFFAGMLATESRGALFACLVALPVMLTILRPGWRRTIMVLVTLAALFAGMQAATGGGMVNRIAHIAAEGSGEDTLKPRIALWDAALGMVKEQPLTGLGLGTFYLQYPAHRPPLTDNSAGSWVHNDPLQFAVEMGVAAPLLFYLILILALIRTGRALRATTDGTLRAFIAAPFCALLTLAIDAHVSFPLYLIPIMLCAGVLLAVWHEATRRAREEVDHAVHFHGWQQSFIGIAAIAIAALLALMAGSSATGAWYLQKARATLKTGNIENFIVLAEKADRWGPPSFIDPQVQLAGLYVDMLVLPPSLIATGEQSELRTAALHLLAQAESMNPAWAEINFKRGRLFAVTGVYGLTPGGESQAQEQYEIAIHKNPMHYRAREELAKILAAQGQPAAAFDILSAGLEYPMPAAINESYIPLMRQLQALAEVQKKYRKTP